ncbi:hypothetical protein FACS189429_1320 [Bacteroidia bacterium]|nr:hypothetical protein FACS189429_1320 [Bacteroidia bacterium]
MFDFLHNFSQWQYVLSVLIGVGLAAAAGFRVFLPMFVASLAAHFGWLDFGESFQWLSGMPALIVTGVATFVEILAYYIPFVDHLLDTLAVPMASIAGTLLFASQFVDTGTLPQWALALIAGGGTAATISTAFAGTRVASTGTTGGVGNSIVSTTETAGAALVSILAIAVPVLAFIVVLVLLFLIFRLGKKIFHKKVKQ